MKKPVLLAITAYQLMRCIALLAPALLVSPQDVTQGGYLLVALSASALAVPLVAFRLAAPAAASARRDLSAVLVSAKLLETAAMAAVIPVVLRSPLAAAFTAPRAIATVASMIALADVVILLFLLLYRQYGEET